MGSTLGGYLVGYGLKRKTGDMINVIFDKPIHNTITKHCLNNLLMFNGTDAISTDTSGKDYCSMFVQCVNGGSSRYGVINFSALGDGVGVTDTSADDLVHRVSDFTSTKKTGGGWSQTVIDNTNAVIKLRISHKHVINTSFTVREIGWFHRIYPDGAYSMSARVQLDVPVPVEPGDDFYSIYEIQVGFQGVEPFADLGGYGGGYKVNAGVYYKDSSGGNYCFPYITANGVAILRSYNTSTNPGESAAHFTPSWTSIPRRAIKCKNNYNKQLAFISETYASNNFNPSSYSFTVKPYVLDSFYRDTVFILNPEMLGENCYGLVLDGVYYRFGTYDSGGNFTATPANINSALQVTVRQSWSTDLLHPTA